MAVYIVSAIILVLSILNFYLGEKLYKVPKDENYFRNVEEYNFSKSKEIGPDPKYVVIISIATGILLGLYFGLTAICNANGIVILFTVLLVMYSYLSEITRRVSLRDGVLVFSKFLSPKKEIDASKVIGMYIYSYNKRFMKNHAYTVKLVVTENNGKKTKFTISSIDNRAVMNLMKENFGVQRNKMYIAQPGTQSRKSGAVTS